MGLDTMGTEIYTIHIYFRGLTVGQRTPGFLGCHIFYIILSFNIYFDHKIIYINSQIIENIYLPKIYP